MNYHALTIGPILKTLLKARKTRELWAASYLFSYLMKQLIKAFKQKGAVFLVPYIESIYWNGGDHDILVKPNGAGIFADRCVFYFPETLEAGLIGKIIQDVKDQVIREIYSYLESQSPKLFHTDKDSKLQDLIQYFNAYLQVYGITKDIPEMTPNREIVSQLFSHLDILELQSHLFPEESHPWMELFLGRAALMRHQPASFLVRDALGKEKFEKTRFESLIEISARELVDALNDSDREDFLKKIGSENDEETSLEFLKSKNPDKYRTAHKYIAIVQADGDKIGAAIKSLQDGQYMDFSKALLEYSLRASAIIREYGGIPVYIGGDDTLFFAPLRYGEKDIFSLIDDLDGLFFKSLSHLELENTPTLSYGISIAYYKFPMTENLSRSHGLLEEAKKFKFSTGEKDAVAAHVQKHSGQEFSIVLQKGSNKKSPENESPTTYALFKSLIRLHIEDNNFLNSVVHHLGRDWPLISHIGQDQEKLKNLFDHNFNEGFHRQEKVQAFLELLQRLILAINKDYSRADSQKIVYGSLRMVKFLNRDDND